MLFSPIAWALFAFTLMVALPGALASPAPKKTSRKSNSSTRVTVETYPAMEDGEIVLPPPPRPQVASDSVTTSQSTPKTAADPAIKFVLVPEQKRSQILKRMQLCQAIFERSGRAYDYRSMTTADLERELSSLSRGKRTVTLRQDASGLFRPVENPTANIAVDQDPILDADFIAD